MNDRTIVTRGDHWAADKVQEGVVYQLPAGSDLGGWTFSLIPSANAIVGIGSDRYTAWPADHADYAQLEPLAVAYLLAPASFGMAASDLARELEERRGKDLEDCGWNALMDIVDAIDSLAGDDTDDQLLQQIDADITRASEDLRTAGEDGVLEKFHQAVALYRGQ